MAAPSVEGVTASTIILVWEPPVSNGGAPVTAYTIYVSGDGGKTYTESIMLYSSNLSSLNLELVENVMLKLKYTSYVFKVSASSAVGEGELSQSSVELSGKYLI